MIRAILFDFYGTLARATSWGPTVEEILRSYGVTLDPEARARWRDEAIDGVEHFEHSLDRERYVAWERARLTRLTAACGVVDTDEIVEALYRAIKSFTLEAYEETPSVLAELRSHGLTLAVCSNWDWELERALVESGLDPGWFDAVVTSAQAGARKPHPRIYQETLDRCGVAAEEALFVGDTWGPDVEGPRRMGMRAVQVWRADRAERGAPPPPTGEAAVPDLRGLAQLL